MDDDRLVSALNCLEDALLVVDREGAPLFRNRTPVRWFGEEEVRQAEWPNRYRMSHVNNGAPLTPDAFPLARVLEERRVDDSEFMLDGRYLRARVQPWSDEASHLLGAVVLVHNVSERRKTEEELRKSQWYLESIVENVPAMIFVKGPRRQPPAGPSAPGCCGDLDWHGSGLGSQGDITAHVSRGWTAWGRERIGVGPDACAGEEGGDSGAACGPVCASPLRGFGAGRRPWSAVT